MQRYDRDIRIFLIEDNPGDIQLIKEAFIESDLCHHLYVASDGVIAPHHIKSSRHQSGLPLLDLILMNLHLPKKDGHQILAEIKANKNSRHIPLAVLSSSPMEKDIRSAYENFVNCYICKHMDLEAYIEIAKSIRLVWADTGDLSTRCRL